MGGDHVLSVESRIRSARLGKESLGLGSKTRKQRQGAGTSTVSGVDSLRWRNAAAWRPAGPNAGKGFAAVRSGRLDRAVQRAPSTGCRPILSILS